MDKIINVTGGNGGKAFLVMGKKKTVLLDCGMAYCASALISNIKKARKETSLDYVLISHSHYDHIGAIPYLRKEWPNLRVFGAEHAQYVLNRENALAAIRDLSKQAAIFYGADTIEDYTDEMMKVDDVISDGDIVDLGGIGIKAIETRGHTKCSLSFLVDNDILFLSESTGYMSGSGTFYPAFITSCRDAIGSIKRCQALNPRLIISPHFGLVSDKDTFTYWGNCMTAIEKTREFILQLAKLGCSEEDMLIEYEEKFRDEESRLEQPSNAFRINTQNMIKTILTHQ